MDFDRILSELRRERMAIDAVIRSLEALHSGASRRGRPPRWLAAMQNEAPSNQARTKSGGHPPAKRMES